MLTGRARVQLAVFVVLTLLGVSFAGYRYAGLNRLFGADSYLVTADLGRAGGLFPNAEVTYLGTKVGRVGAMRLTDNGIQVDLNIDSNAPPIPADTRAVVADRSAVGEQYLDLRPDHNTGPYLRAGSRIALDHTSLPPAVQEVLSDVDSLTKSVPVDSVRTVVDELDVAFTGTGPELQKIIDSVRSFTATASEHLPQTGELLRSAHTVLDTQLDLGSDIVSFSADLSRIAAQLKQSDGDLRRLISAAPQAGHQISDLLRETGPDLGALLANVLSVNKVLLVHRDGIEQTLVTYPWLSAIANTTVVNGKDGMAHLNLIVTKDAPPCVRGYDGTTRRSPDVTSDAPANNAAHCAEPAGSPTGVRGSQNAPPDGAAPPPPDGPLPGLLGRPGLTGATSLDQLLGLPSG
ncbi:MCE family protein [Solihabitans fulvus]|uniref:MCE family protein n=1 Tax=Solihabitans fulvus TaxID=1892852 RepID=A0A5B2WH33_9PSEU|nr:MlaD family protein [Solihabitans fulvus]KAA2250178.1 MCE family protein [Solihabitans fulvus]